MDRHFDLHLGRRVPGRDRGGLLRCRRNGLVSARERAADRLARRHRDPAFDHHCRRRGRALFGMAAPTYRERHRLTQCTHSLPTTGKSAMTESGLSSVAVNGRIYRAPERPLVVVCVDGTSLRFRSARRTQASTAQVETALGSSPWGTSCRYAPIFCA